MSARQLLRFRTKSVFVNGLMWTTGQAELKQYFENFGKVAATYIFMDNYRGISKGHAIVQFENNEGVDAVLKQQQHFVDGQEVVVKKQEHNF